MTNIMGNVCAIYMIVGLGVNMTRYMEIAFLQPAFIANIITGEIFSLMVLHCNIIPMINFDTELWYHST